MLAYPPEVLAAFRELAPLAAIASPLTGAVARGAVPERVRLQKLCTLCGLSMARAGEMSQVLSLARQHALMERHTDLVWSPRNYRLHVQLAALLEGVELYIKEVYRPENVVNIVVSLPPSPSFIGQALSDSLAGKWGLLDTRQVLPVVAETAKEHLIVLTPYLDKLGAEVVLNLFQRSACPHRTLISRSDNSGAPPEGIHLIASQLRALSVALLDCRIPRSDGAGAEMSHGKVVLADETDAYVGSANMNRWSFEHSLEIGVHISGNAVQKVARVLKAIAFASLPFT